MNDLTVTNSPRQPVNMVHFDITEFCNYHCEYCYQGVEKQQKHISDTVFNNFFAFLERLKEPFRVHLIGGEPFLYPRFFEMCRKIAQLGHYISLTTNFSLPLTSWDRLRKIAGGFLRAVEISLHPTQIRNLEDFFETLSEFNEWLGGGRKPILRLNVVLTENNFDTVMTIRKRLEDIGLSLNIQRFALGANYQKYSGKIEAYLRVNKGIDIPLGMLEKAE